jgi:hypothetical protein
MSEQLSIDFARQLRDRGMERAVDHAEREVAGWKDAALEYVRLYALIHAEFICEDVRGFADRRGFAPPPDGRAWGAVMMRAAKRGLVTKTDRVACAKDPKVHMNPSTVWRSNLL